MDAPTILTAMAAAAAFLKKPVEDLTSKAVLDGYEALKGLLMTKTNSSEEVTDAIQKLESKPDSKARLDLLNEELASYKIHDDTAIAEAVASLLKVLPQKNIGQSFHVSIQQTGRGNKAQVAAGNIINTERHTEVVKFTPDERHINGEQGQRIKQLVEKLATTLAREDGKPNFGEAWSSLYRQFKIGSFLQLEKKDFDAAVSFLQQRCAINRPKLRRSNPPAYRNSFYATIWAKAKQLGWQKPELYSFAQQKLDLKKPVTSLKQLGPNQLKSLYEFIVRE